MSKKKTLMLIGMALCGVIASPLVALRWIKNKKGLCCNNEADFVTDAERHTSPKQKETFKGLSGANARAV